MIITKDFKSIEFWKKSFINEWCQKLFLYAFSPTRR